MSEHETTIREAAGHIARGCLAATSHDPNHYLIVIDATLEAWKAEHAAEVETLKREHAKARATLEAIVLNAQSFHASEDGKQRALTTIGAWARDALDGGIHESVLRITGFHLRALAAAQEPPAEEAAT